jgi:hypothetical protein
MATYYSPSIVTNGLVLCLDAGNSKSYPGTGTTWTDISNNGNNGVLTNGPTFNSANGGGVVFDGVNDYISVPYSKDLGLNTGVTFELFLKPASLSTYQVIFNCTTTGTTTMLYIGQAELAYSAFRPHISLSTGYYYGSIVYQFSINNWYHVCYSYSSSTGFASYVNAVPCSVQWTTSAPAVGATVTSFSNPNSLSIGYDTRGVLNYSGSLSNLRIYNRQLPGNEILQNYNATKSRFGL